MNKLEYTWDINIDSTIPGHHPIRAIISVSFPEIVLWYMENTLKPKWLTAIYMATSPCLTSCTTLKQLKKAESYNDRMKMRNAYNTPCPYTMKKTHGRDSAYIISETKVVDACNSSYYIVNTMNNNVMITQPCLNINDKSHRSKIEIYLGATTMTLNRYVPALRDNRISGTTGAIVAIPRDTEIDKAKKVFATIGDTIGSYYVDRMIEDYTMDPNSKLSRDMAPAILDYMRFKPFALSKNKVRKINYV